LHLRHLQPHPQGDTHRGSDDEKAWVAEEVPQCGYCQSGQIMSAAALLAKNKNPSDAEIEKAMDGHICTCGTYNRIRKAIHTAAAMMRKGA
jgi:aerobic-type carbon monoxide dehydrogenase small subunit (CoxS/CutS family)